MNKQLAFPQILKLDNIVTAEGGLTKREFMVTAILSAMVTTQNCQSIGRGEIKAAIRVTDELLKELE